jgi:hypothetical protein
MGGDTTSSVTAGFGMFHWLNARVTIVVFAYGSRDRDMEWSHKSQSHPTNGGPVSVNTLSPVTWPHASQVFSLRVAHFGICSNFINDLSFEVDLLQIRTERGTIFTRRFEQRPRFSVTRGSS